MGDIKKNIIINAEGKNIELTIFSESSAKDTLFEVTDAFENGEATIQIVEGCFYEYIISPSDYYLKGAETVSQSKINRSAGRISPNIYVGTLSLSVHRIDNDQEVATVKLEVQSVKASYRKDYRFMLEEITEKCMDLLLQQNSPVSSSFEPDFKTDARTLYQRFAFIKSVLDSNEFNNSIHKILSSPNTKWKETEIEKDIRSIRRINNHGLRQITNASKRIDLPNEHSLKSLLTTIPSKITTSHKIETVDTPENRFVKYALQSFLVFIENIRSRVNTKERLHQEALLLEEQLEQVLNHSIFRDVSSITSLPLNSPILQRKEGYREVLRAWLMFDLAAKLIWKGGDDVYDAGKRDVAVLYEYWLFFQLLDVLKDIFKIDSKFISDLIESTTDGLGLKLKQGKHFPVEGVYESETRKLNIQFSYNRTFSGDREYPAAGSWTRSLRPDYTLTIWPHGIDQEQAEKEELIVHIHFDAKYKVDQFEIPNDTDEELDNIKESERKGSYKRADLLKMHSYKDAIRRTAGAYVLYPGSITKIKRGFHELIPGLGAFPISPSKEDNGTNALKSFLKDVVHHFLNRTSQREIISLKTYETYKNDEANQLHEALPETYGAKRDLLPNETFVLVAFFDRPDQLDWIEKNSLYNARMGSTRGSIRLSPKETGSKYILLHTHGDAKNAGRLLRLKKDGPKIFSRKDLEKKNYPNPSQEFYVVYEILGQAEQEFKNFRWDITRLDDYSSGRSSALPFAVSLSELMKVVIK